MKSLRRAFTSTIGAAVLAVALTATPAQAGFPASNTLTAGGVTYTAKAESCYVYVSLLNIGCSWSAGASISKTKTFTHRVDVKANGINVKLSISADPGATITGNNTTLVTATEKGTGKSNSMAGKAKPGLSISVSARSRLTVGSTTVNSGWTTW